MDEPPPLPTPEPPHRRGWRVAAVAVSVGAMVGAIGAFIHVPYYALGPGPARDVASLVRVSGQRTYPSEGTFFLTTVAVSTRPVSLVDAFTGWLDPATAVVPRSIIVRPGLTDEQQDEFNALDMERSKYNAVIAAVRALGLKAPLVPGARVLSVVPRTPADAALEPGDLITAVDGVPVRDPASAGEAIRASPVGTTLRLSIRRGAETKEIPIRTIASPLSGDNGTPVIGAALVPGILLPIDVTVDSGNIGGPSAGLAFALSIVDSLVPEDLTRGHRVAVTGTIEPDGTVGPVGGVAFKVRAAEREGADVFLVPADEVEEASAAAEALRVIGVSSLPDAIEQLRTLDLRASKAA